MHPFILKDHVAQALFGLGLKVDFVGLAASGEIQELSAHMSADICRTFAEMLPLDKPSKVYIHKASGKGLGLAIDWPRVSVAMPNNSVSFSDKELDAYDALTFAVQKHLFGVLKHLSHRLGLLCSCTPKADSLVRTYRTQSYEVKVFVLRNERFISTKWPLITVEYLCQQIEHEAATVFGIKVVVASRKSGKVVIEGEENRIFSSNRRVITGQSVARRLLKELNAELRLRKPSLQHAA